MTTWLSEKFELLYPEKKLVTREWLILKAADCFENGETNELAQTTNDAIRILEDLGHITVKRG